MKTPDNNDDLNFMPKHVLLVKHAMPILDASVPPREWVLGRVGRFQARWLASELRTVADARLVASSEPKALETGQIIAEELGTTFERHDALDEIDRPVMPILSSGRYEHLVKQVFDSPSKAVIGKESAFDAARRYSQRLELLIRNTQAQTLVVISHGIVVSLVIGWRSDVDGFTFWKSFSCASRLILDASTYQIIDLITPPTVEIVDAE